MTPPDSPYSGVTKPRSGCPGVFMKPSYPVLPLRDIVVFPHRIVPLFVGRDKSVAALEAAMADDKEIFLVAQLDPSEDDPGREDLYDTGVTAEVLQLLKLPDGTVRVLVAGKVRGQLDVLVEDGPYLTASISPVEEGDTRLEGASEELDETIGKLTADDLSPE